MTRQKHTCDVCRKTGYWGKHWQVYGSIRWDEECGHMVVTCSEKCRNDPKAQRLIDIWKEMHPKWARKCKAV